MSPVKSRREQYSQATRAALLDAATVRFAAHGFAGTALEDVATDIQATRGAVYHHFANKTALFEAVFDELETEMMREIIEVTAVAGDAWQAALAGVESFLQRCCDPVYGRVVWQEAPIAMGWKRWKECEEHYAYGLIEGMISALVGSGDLPKMPVEPMARITFHILGAAGMAMADAADEDKLRTKAEYSDTILFMLTSVRQHPRS